MELQLKVHSQCLHTLMKGIMVKQSVRQMAEWMLLNCIPGMETILTPLLTNVATETQTRHATLYIHSVSVAIRFYCEIVVL